MNDLSFAGHLLGEYEIQRKAFKAEKYSIQATTNFSLQLAELQVVALIKIIELLEKAPATIVNNHHNDMDGNREVNGVSARTTRRRKV